MPNPRSPTPVHSLVAINRHQWPSMRASATGGDGDCFKEACFLRIWSKQRGALNLEKSD